jgi:hypothetical protein
MWRNVLESAVMVPSMKTVSDALTRKRSLDPTCFWFVRKGADGWLDVWFEIVRVENGKEVLDIRSRPVGFVMSYLIVSENDMDVFALSVPLFHSNPSYKLGKQTHIFARQCRASTPNTTIIIHTYSVPDGVFSTSQNPSSVQSSASHLHHP